MQEDMCVAHPALGELVRGDEGSLLLQEIAEKL